MIFVDSSAWFALVVPALMRRLNVRRPVSLDHYFRQLGEVEVVP